MKNFPKSGILRRGGIIAISILVLAGILLACANPAGSNGGDPITPVKTALEAKIAEAEAAKAGVSVSEDGTDVSSFLEWVTPGVMDVFDAAINAADAIFANANATQAEIDAATSVLNAAIGVFNAAKASGTKTSGWTQDELDVLIDEAKAAIADLVPSNFDGDDISPLDTWVEASVLYGLNNAISVAEGSGDIDERYNDLAAALSAFYAETPKPGNTPNKAALNSAIAEAELMLTQVVEANDKTEAPVGSVWGTGTQIDTLSDAYYTAIYLRDDENATVNRVKAMLEILAAAIEAINDNPDGEKEEFTLITITGLPSSFNGDMFMLALSESSSGDDFVNYLFGSEPEISNKVDYVVDGSVKLYLYIHDEYTEDDFWAGDSVDRYIGFLHGPGLDPETFKNGVYISKVAYNFGTTKNLEIPFTAFTKCVFSVKIDDLFAMFGEDYEDVFGSTSPTLDDLIFFMSEGEFGYEGAKENQGVELFKNKALTIEFSGSDPITPKTTFYAVFPFWLMAMEGGGGEALTSITIKGLPPALNGGIFALALSKYPDGDHFVEFISGATRPEVSSEGMVVDGSVKVFLNSGESYWAGDSEDWYIGFLSGLSELEAYANGIFISNGQYSFGTRKHYTIDFSAFTKSVFSVKIDDLFAMFEKNYEDVFGSTSPTLDDLIFLMSNDEFDYNGIKAAQGVQLFKNEALTIEFSGSDTIDQDTIIYAAFPFWLMAREGGGSIGEIYGTITFTNIPNDLREIWLSVKNDDDGSPFDCGVKLDLSEYTEGEPLYFTIPIYKDMDYESGRYCVFQIKVEFQDAHERVFTFSPTTTDDLNWNVHDLGTVDLDPHP